MQINTLITLSDAFTGSVINVSLVKEQVELGVAVRMACLKMYCKK